MNDEVQSVSLDRIDAPSVAMRSVMNDEKLEELAASIKSQGLIQPVTLRKVGDRYEIIAGHRRVTACRRAGLAMVSAIVREYDDAQADSVRMHENLYREDVNPVDEGQYIRLMVDKHGVEPAQLAKMTGKSPAYLMARYDLLDFAPEIVEAVKAEYISLTAAQWLQKITNENVRREYTRFAMLGGITAKRAEAWFRSWEAGNLPRDAAEYTPPPEVEAGPAPKLMEACVLCGYRDELDNLRMVYAHPDCQKAAAQMAKEPAPVEGAVVEA